jgi:hypothetical protein
MFLGQKTQKQVVPATDEERSFVSIPRRESVYCEDRDTISIRRGAACGVCRSYATLPLSRLLQAATRERPRAANIVFECRHGGACRAHPHPPR